jgi:hypothetical protein
VGAIDRDAGSRDPAIKREDEHRVHVLRAPVGTEGPQLDWLTEALLVPEAEIVEVHRSTRE